MTDILERLARFHPDTLTDDELLALGRDAAAEIRRLRMSQDTKTEGALALVLLPFIQEGASYWGCDTYPGVRCKDNCNCWDITQAAAHAAMSHVAAEQAMSLTELRDLAKQIDREVPDGTR